jgi:hypothetical protein
MLYDGDELPGSIAFCNSTVTTNFLTSPHDPLFFLFFIF